MVTRTIYVPANKFGRHILEYIWTHIGCSMGEIRKVANVLCVPITMPQREIKHFERILQTFDLM